MATRFSATRTVLFDVDGTLLDTRELIFRAYEHATAEKGIAAPDREWLRFQIGRELGAVYKDIAPDSVPELIALHRDFQANNIDLSAPYTGAEAALGKLRRAGIQMATVTSRSVRTSVRTLETANLARYFPVMISAEDAPALKPDPAPLLLALERLGQPPETAIMVGDSAHDIHAARALGIRVVAATYGFPGAEIMRYRPDAFIDDIRDLPALLGL
jgi:HAD superfamily hydrolase (TIGR01509 family)